jgi:monofunctional biosynthetic peptidoglycan transglycosylase
MLGQNINAPSLSLLFGLLLMTYPGPAPGAAESHGDAERLLTDFTPASSDFGWYVVNDNVMGGRSEGDFEREEKRLFFAGRTNTNGGGFSSIRTKPLELDLSNQTGIRLEVKGDGRRYTWRLTTNARWRGRQISYWADFETQDGAWSTVSIPFSDFIPQFRGYQLDGPVLDPAEITGMGLMIYDKQDGPFELELASVRAYSDEMSFALTQYHWKNRVLVISAPSEDDERLNQQQDEVAATPEEFADRDMVLVTLLDNAVSTAGDRELTADEAAMARAALAVRQGSFALRLIGKDGTIKLSSETTTPMTEIYGLIDTMPMRRKEKPSG